MQPDLAVSHQFTKASGKKDFLTEENSRESNGFYKTIPKEKMKLNQKTMLALVIGLGLWGCVEDENYLEVQPAAINFEYPTVDLALGQEPVKIKMNLDQPASKAGTVQIRLTGDATYGEEFETLPAISDQYLNLPIEKGKAYLELTFIPKEEGKFDGEKTVSMELETVSDGFKIGSISHSTITLRDEIQPVKVSFKVASLEIEENQEEASEIQISLEGIVRFGSFIKVKLNSEAAAYGSRFVTDPVSVNGEILLYPQPDTDVITFKFRPVNDNQVRADYSIPLAIVETGNHMEIGEENELLVTIKEDDQLEIPETHSIAALRNEFLREDDWYLPTDYFIQGVITSNDNIIQNSVYIQDETAGILIKFTSENLLKRGDLVRINLKSGEAVIFNEQEGIRSVSDRLGVKLDENVSVVPETITLEQLHTGNYKGKLVRIEKVVFPEADGTVTFDNARSISDGTLQGLVHTHSSAQFHNRKLPNGTVNVTGIVGDWNRILPQVYHEDILVVP